MYFSRQHQIAFVYFWGSFESTKLKLSSPLIFMRDIIVIGHSNFCAYVPWKPNLFSQRGVPEVDITLNESAVSLTYFVE
jgi:hypothetical protein